MHACMACNTTCAKQSRYSDDLHQFLPVTRALDARIDSSGVKEEKNVNKALPALPAFLDNNNDKGDLDMDHDMDLEIEHVFLKTLRIERADSREAARGRGESWLDREADEAIHKTEAGEAVTVHKTEAGEAVTVHSAQVLL